MTQPHKPGCTCTATHEGSCQDSRAETPCQHEKFCPTPLGEECEQCGLLRSTIENFGKTILYKKASPCHIADVEEVFEPSGRSLYCTFCGGEVDESKIVGITGKEKQETPRKECCEKCYSTFENPHTVGCININCSCHTQTPRGWEERFHTEFPYRTRDTQEFQEKARIKSFIASEIQSAVEAERRRIADECQHDFWRVVNHWECRKCGFVRNTQQPQSDMHTKPMKKCETCKKYYCPECFSVCPSDNP